MAALFVVALILALLAVLSRRVSHSAMQRGESLLSWEYREVSSGLFAVAIFTLAICGVLLWAEALL